MSVSSSTERPDIAIVMPYYDNPQMWAYQLEHFRTLDPKIARRVEVIVVDDASPHHPAVDAIGGDLRLVLSVFRIERDKPWNQDAARNIGVHEATAPYVLLTDIDHIVPEATLEGLLSLKDSSRVFSLGRGAHFSDAKVAPHVNSYFLSKDLYWSIGGYDEDFWGLYGTDKLFRNRVMKRHDIVLKKDLVLELVTQGSIPDAKNKVFSRNPSILRRVVGLGFRFLKFLRVLKSPRVLVNPYTKVFPVAQGR
ncbi:MAG: glycosyltransferase family 2 protein [Pontimonas sp.]|nr:glycosyltransferase family 2 protein [Pontimonas sp.]